VRSLISFPLLEPVILLAHILGGQLGIPSPGSSSSGSWVACPFPCCSRII